MPISAEIKYERRNKILSRTRELIREVGTESLNVRELAEFCGVSVPTIYNLFDSKENLVTLAADEVFYWHLDQLRLADDMDGLDKLLKICESTSEIVLRNRDLCKHLVAKGPRTDRDDTRSISLARDLYTEVVRQMQQANQLDSWISAEFVGKRMHEHVRYVAVELTNGNLKSEHFVSMRRAEIAMCLLGIARGATKERLKALLESEATVLE